MTPTLPDLTTDRFLDALERVIFSRNSTLASGDIIPVVLSKINSEDDDRFDMAEVRDAANIAVENMLLALRRREVSLQGMYPLRINGDAIQLAPNWEKGNPYVLLKFLRNHRDPPNSIREAFETTASSAVAEFFRGKMIRTGDPQRDPVPNSTKEMAAYVAREIGDGIGPVSSIEYPESGDLSIDAFVHHKFGEPRDSGKTFISQRLIIAVNCATGVNWLAANKPYEPIVSNAREFWENFVSPIWPVFCVPDFDIQPYARKQAGGCNVLIFGGWRISLWSRSVPNDAVEWTQAEIKKIPKELESLPLS